MLNPVLDTNPVSIFDIGGKVIQWWGPPGAIILVLSLVIYRLYKRVSDCQEKRVKDAKEHSDLLVTLANSMSNTMNDLTHAIGTLRDTVTGLKDIVLITLSKKDD